MIVRIDATSCVGCGICLASCPTGAIEMEAGYAVVLAEQCRGCQACQMVCPQEAIVEDPEQTERLMSVSGRYRRW